VLCPSIGWKGRDMEEGEVLKMDELGGRGAGDVEGCLREYALVVRYRLFLSAPDVNLFLTTSLLG
jgi:hypothetical protein